MKKENILLMALTDKECDKITNMLTRLSTNLDKKEKNRLFREIINYKDHVLLVTLKIMLHSDDMTLQDHFRELTSITKFRNVLQTKFNGKYETPVETIKAVCGSCLTKEPNITCDNFVKRVVGLCNDYKFEVEDISKWPTEIQKEYLMGLRVYMKKLSKEE